MRTILVMLLVALLLVGCGYSPPDPASRIGTSYHKLYQDYTNGITVEVVCGHSSPWVTRYMNEDDCLITIRRVEPAG